MNRAAGANQQVSLLMDSAQVIPDERSNSLIVYATKRDMEVITNVTTARFPPADGPDRTVIVDVALDDKFDFGVPPRRSEPQVPISPVLEECSMDRLPILQAVRNAGTHQSCRPASAISAS